MDFLIYKYNLNNGELDYSTDDIDIFIFFGVEYNNFDSLEYIL